MKDDNIIHIYTDGSCIDNPGGNGGFGVVILDNLDIIKLSGFSNSTTNQRMEIKGVIEGLRYFKEKKDIIVYTDSAYVCNCINKEWYVKWLNNGWVNSKKDPVANKDLWEELILLIEFHNVKIKKVKGHSTNVLNNECDSMAREIIDFTLRMRKELFIN